MFKNMKISLRLGLSFSFMLLLIIVLIGVGINSMSKIHQNMDEIVNVENVRTKLANNMISNVREVSIALRTILLEKNKTALEEQKKNIEDYRKSYDEDLIRYEALVTKDKTKILEEISKVKILCSESRALNNIVFALAAEGKYDAAIEKMLKNAKPKVKAWKDNIDLLVMLEDKSTSEQYQNAQNVYANVRFIMFLFGFIALVVAATIAFLLARSITKPLKLATNLVLTRDLSLDISEYENGGGELGLMIQSFRKDISEWMRLEEEMKKAAGYARNLIEASLDPLVTISAEGKITDVNAATIKVTGVLKEQLIGSDFANYFTEPEKARTGYKQVFSQGVVIDYPLTLRNSSGLTIDVLYNASVYRNEAGEVQGVFAAARDITDRKRLEEDMKSASQYARNLIEASLDPLVTISAEGKITDVNAATIKVTGVSREQLIGSDFANYFTEPEKARIGYKQVFSQGVVIDYPLTMRNSSGQTMEVLYNASVYRNEAGEVLGIFAAARDITASKLQEKELKAYRDQLEETVKQRTADLTKIIIEVRETVNILASASTEILAATNQVATGTAETATAINETSTTVVEVQQASKQSSQKAQNVADSAQKVVQVFQNGKKAVEETTAGIANIKEQMDSIAQTVVKLSEQSQSIGGIIASVSDIADQSNLLAVNAAIEAAKAGEQGKGFAVVAQEIKNLASQSKQATLKIRNILNDVQKATGETVMATEQGSRAVESGLKQSLVAGEAIRILSESSNQAVQAATQIVASSQQQVVGMDQIGIAMQNISQAGTETAVSMVQAERSARNLYELGQKLKDLIDKFKE